MLDADGPRGGSDEPADREPDDGDTDAGEAAGAYERAQPDSQPTVSSEPEPDEDPANAG
ncbi:MAG: hypothetical protein WAL22_02375 [Solirubrobacteraceae bacterium]